MDDESELVRCSLEGDRPAFARLIHMHQPSARRVALAMAAPADVDDVIQDATVKAFTRLHQYDPARSFRGWFVAIVANEARNRHRSAGRRTRLAERVASRAEPGPHDPADDAVAAERRRALAAALDAMAPADREVIALRYLAELSEAETAAALDCAAGTVKSRLHRALVRLRTALVDVDGGGDGGGDGAAQEDPA